MNALNPDTANVKDGSRLALLLKFSGFLFSAPFVFSTFCYVVYLLFNIETFKWYMQGRNVFILLSISIVSYYLGRIFNSAFRVSQFYLFVSFALIRALVWILLVHIVTVVYICIYYWFLQISIHSTWRQFEFIPTSIREMSYRITAIEFYPACIVTLIFASIVRWKSSKLGTL